jgi:FtsX-like permease family protein
MSGAVAVCALAGRGLWAHRARLALSVLAVVLGVAFIAATLALTDSLTAGIANLAPERATATVRAATTLAEEARPALPADLPGRLRRLEGGRLELVAPGRAVQDDSAGVGAFLDTVAGILRGFGILALVVGSFLIFNTLSMLAALRIREFGLLRVVGATPRQLGLLVILEAAMVGGGASLLGVAVGATAAACLLAWLASRQVLVAGLDDCFRIGLRVSSRDK